MYVIIEHASLADIVSSSDVSLIKECVIICSHIQI